MIATVNPITASMCPARLPRSAFGPQKLFISFTMRAVITVITRIDSLGLYYRGMGFTSEPYLDT